MDRYERSRDVVIIGAGPAGLTAAYELARQGIPPVVLEKTAIVGGIARTEEHRRYRFDIGGHRFYTKIPEVQALWLEMLGSPWEPRCSISFAISTVALHSS